MIELDRVAAGAGPAVTGEFLAGAAEVDITPHADLPMAGYSTESQKALGVSGRLFARAFFFQDGAGERVAICVADLMSGTRYLLEKAARQTAATCGITTDRLVLIGTHTHTAPGWIYGNSLYDTFASVEPGFDPGLSDWLAGRIADAVTMASGNAEPAKLGRAQTSLWSVTRNRSLSGFQADPRSAQWNSPGNPGVNAVSGLTPEQRAVDPRVRVLAAFRQGDDSPIGAIAFFGAHFTSIGPDAEYFSADLAGYAVRKARYDVERDVGGNGVVIALAPSAAGDVNTLRDGLDPEIGTGPRLARYVGVKVGRRIGNCVLLARSGAEPVPIRCGYAEPERGDRPDGVTGPDTELSDHWSFGAPTMAGSEESRTWLHDWGFVEEPGPDRSDPPHFPRSDPQHPKAPALGIVQDVMRKFLDLNPAPVTVLHQVALGPTVIAGVPGEPTTLAAHQIEREVLSASRARSAIVVGYSGDYSGYFTTEPQYRRQHYEGSSTLYGRNTTSYLAAWHRRLAESPTTPPSGTVAFDTGPERREFKAASRAEAVADPRARVKMAGARLELFWRMKRGTRIVFADEWFVRVEEMVGGDWRPLQFMGRDYDDYWHVFHVRRVPPPPLSFDIFNSHESWKATVFLPASALDPVRPLRMAVAARDRFEGFEVELPVG